MFNNSNKLLNFKKIAFLNILEKTVPNIKKYEPEEEFVFIPLDSTKPIDYINQSFVRGFLQNSKFQQLKDYLNNPFLSSEKKDEMLTFFYLAQRIKNSFEKFIRIIKYKKMRKYEFDSDLYLEPLSNFNSKFVVSIVQQDTIYNFRIHDLIRIIQDGLLYAPELFADPHVAKNPHTNLDFSYTDLYNIYLHAYSSNIKIPELFHYYFLCNFNIDKMVEKYESILRDINIKRRVNDMDNDDKYEEIMDMVSKFKRTLSCISISERFPVDKVVDRFQHSLENFMYYKYSYTPNIRQKNKVSLVKKLEKINNETPTFGRMYYRVNRSLLTNNPTPSLTTTMSRYPFITSTSTDRLLNTPLPSINSSFTSSMLDNDIADILSNINNLESTLGELEEDIETRIHDIDSIREEDDESELIDSSNNTITEETNSEELSVASDDEMDINTFIERHSNDDMSAEDSNNQQLSIIGNSIWTPRRQPRGIVDSLTTPSVSSMTEPLLSSSIYEPLPEPSENVINNFDEINIDDDDDDEPYSSLPPVETTIVNSNVDARIEFEILSSQRYDLRTQEFNDSDSEL